MNKPQWGATGLLAGVFVLGAVLGGVGTSVAERGGSREHRGRGGRDGYVERLNAALSLSNEQADSVRAILQRYEPRMDSLWREVRPRFDAAREGVRQEIMMQLTAEQRLQYQEMLEQRDREYRNRRSNGRK